MHIDNVTFLILSKNAYTKFSAGPLNSKGYALFHKHQYPSEGGCFEITVKALVWGLSRNKTTPDRDTCLFVCGLLKDHTPIKFRWYLKQPLIGVYPNDLALAHWGDSWLMGCIIAKDGAANLAFAVPMNGLPASAKILTYEDTFLTPKTGKTATSLDEKIAAANRKSTAD